MAKDIDDLLRDVFGSGKSPRSIQTQKAESYLQQSRRMDQGLDALQRQQQDMNQQLQSQLEELKQMSGELDFDKIQKEVERDFGVSVKPQEMQKTAVCAEGAQKLPEAQRFGDLAQELSKTLIGQDGFLKKLVIAFKRPYVAGWDAPHGLRNAILVTGGAGTGKHTAVRLVTEALAQRELFPSSEVQTLNLALYPGQNEEKLFLQDLYQALIRGGVVVLENYESCHPAFLQQLSELICTGSLRLSSRYVMQKGHLVDAGTALASETVGSISANGCYLVIVSRKGLEELAGAFGARLVDSLGDVCRTEQLSPESLRAIGSAQLAALCEKTEKQLGFALQLPEDAGEQVARQFTPQNGVADMAAYCDRCFKALAQYKLEHDAPAQTVALTVRDGRLMAGLDGGDADLLGLLPGGYHGELEAVKAEMEQIVGLDEIKRYVLSLEDHYKVQQLRKAKGMKTGSLSMHMIFTGNPGTGKTTIARLVSKYLKAIGVLSGGQLVEVSRADLVGKYVGHTAPLTNQVIKSAIGGVLFIDEAYSLYRGQEDSFGLEAIDALVKGMEDNRNDLIVILAGYSREMEVFLTANSGLRSRFPNMIEFPDYTGEELTQIAELTASSKGYRIEPAAKEALLDYFSVIQGMEQRESGNGRLARNVVESAILAQSKRVIAQPDTPLDLLQRADFDLFE